MTIFSKCTECGSEKLIAKYRIVNRNTHYVYRHLACAECGAPSTLENLFDCEKDRLEYATSYFETHNKDISYEQFSDKILGYITDKIIETILEDERENLIKRWRGYVSLEEIHSFLRW